MKAKSISLEEAKAHARAVVERSGTSFGPGMRILSKERRAGMYAIYAFCREVDDIADEGGDRDQKLADLAEWRNEVDRIYDGDPRTRTGLALADCIARFPIQKQELILMIEGMEMDANGPIIAPTLDQLFAYTRRVAGAAGMMSMPVFGASTEGAGREFSLSLGDALQLTNILRDVEEDATIGRLYLPRELLEQYDCPLDPATIAQAPGLPNVKRKLAAVAAENFAAARVALKSLDWRMLRPALLMMGVYETYLNRMTKKRFENGAAPVRISKLEKTIIASRWYFAPVLKGRHVAS